ncbi:type II toxin-antitoxin system VapC family toxin [Limnothrix sp. FACHB-881]|uniref:type II toxin-antitoxin system VapC family toxin n=1 Tax=Limnothrix sp. FACHB-881 TaxID=2692819 RepID=UPI001687A03E|nr:type II toxin-antitoxin system VapC family toxin [Limnothrix sp. FACHB-881]MBD2636736.1 type II toxin-antitoxin system VapC family toxin [Limnothrix sp. FACHB-881]
MIILDTHIWIWWVHGDPKLSQSANQIIQSHESTGLGISVISCWEVAKLVEYQRLKLPCGVLDWLNQALAYPGITLLELTPEIVVTSTQLTGFHRDPADQRTHSQPRRHYPLPAHHRSSARNHSTNAAN